MKHVWHIEWILLCSQTNYLEFVQRLLVLWAGCVRWIENDEPRVQSTVMGAWVYLRYTIRQDPQWMKSTKHIPEHPAGYTLRRLSVKATGRRVKPNTSCDIGNEGQQQSSSATVPDRRRSSVACALKARVARWCAFPRVCLSVGRCRRTPLGKEVPGWWFPVRTPWALPPRNPPVSSSHSPAPARTHIYCHYFLDLPYKTDQDGQIVVSLKTT